MQKKQKHYTEYFIGVETETWGCESTCYFSTSTLKRFGKQVRRELEKRYRKEELLDLLIYDENMEDPMECYDLSGYHKGRVFIYEKEEV